MKRFVFWSALVFIFSSVHVASAAIYSVTKIADTNDGLCDADCSLREAIAAANATPDNDSIAFSSLFSTPQTITLSGTDLIIANSGTLIINGPGKDKLTVSGNSLSRVFTNNTGSVAFIRNLRVTGGTGASTVTTGRGGGLYNNGGTLTLENLIISGNTAANGGAANNAGTATLNIISCTLSGNSSTGAGGALQNFAGNTLNIRDSSIYGNTSNSTITGGGAIQANGALNIANTTFANNNAQGGSGGAITFNGTGLTLNNVTISGNLAGVSGGGIHRTGTNPLNIRNSIIANNTNVQVTTPDVSGAVNSQGNNIIGNLGTSTGWIASDLQNTDPRLGPLGFYGEPGFSFPLTSASPAINGGQICVADLSCAAANPIAQINLDQRGAGRDIATGLDIGAFESAANFFALLPNGRIGQAYSQTAIPALGGFSFNLSDGMFPPGISSTGPNLTFGGNPNQTGTFLFEVRGTSGQNIFFAKYRLNVLTASPTVSIGGRVIANGNGVPKASVKLVSPNGGVKDALTNGLGRYRFDDVEVGQSFTIVVESKAASYPAPVVFVTDTVTNLDITPILQ